MARTSSQDTGSRNVRMGPLALFTLVAVLCLTVLAMLAVSTSNATLALAERRAEATKQLYLDELAAQSFVAALDSTDAQTLTEDANTTAAGPGTDASDDQALSAALEAAQSATDGQVEVSAYRSDDAVHASFDCGNGRQLNIKLSLLPDGGFRIDEWRMTTVVNDEPVMGDLFGSL